MSKATSRAAPTPRSSPTKRRTRPSARRSRKRSSASSGSSKRRSILSESVALSDSGWMAEAVRLGEVVRGSTAPNPNVGCVIVRDGEIIGRGATGPGGRPHAEALALAEAGERAGGATLYTTLEPCAHVSPRGPTCANLIPATGIARVVAALEDPDPRTAGQGFAALRAAGIDVT